MLHEAVNRQDMDVVSAVISSKSPNISLETFDNWTALDMAVNRKWTEGQRVLVEAGGRTGRANDVESESDNEELSDMEWSVTLMNFRIGLRYALLIHYEPLKGHTHFILAIT